MDEQEFKTRADEALTDLYRRLAPTADEHDFEVDFNAGALAVEFASPPAKFRFPRSQSGKESCTGPAPFPCNR